MLSEIGRIWLQQVLLPALLQSSTARVQEVLSVQLTDTFSALSKEGVCFMFPFFGVVGHLCAGILAPGPTGLAEKHRVFFPLA